MDSIMEHNLALQQNGFFSATDLEANRQGRFSDFQRRRLEEERAYVRQNVGKYEKGTPLVVSIFAAGLVIFTVALYLVGAFDFLKDMLGSLALPVLAIALAAALFFILVVIPRQYRDSVNAYKSMGTPLAEAPLGEIQVIEARAEVYSSQGGINRRGHQSSKISHVLQMEGIRFLVPESLRHTIQSQRCYRVYAVNDQGAWMLLSMETIEGL